MNGLQNKVLPECVLEQWMLQTGRTERSTCREHRHFEIVLFFQKCFGKRFVESLLLWSEDSGKKVLFFGKKVLFFKQDQLFERIQMTFVQLG